MVGINTHTVSPVSEFSRDLVVQRLNPLEYPDWDQLLMTHPDYTFFHSAAWARVLHDTYGNIPSYFAIIDESEAGSQELEVRSQKAEGGSRELGVDNAGSGKNSALRTPHSALNLSIIHHPSSLETPPAAPRHSTPDTRPATLLGLFPVMEANSPILGRRAFSLPYSDECQPLLSPSPITRERDGVRVRPMFEQLWQTAISYGQSRKWKFLLCQGANGLFGDTPPSLTYYGHTLDLSVGEEQLFSRLESSVRRAIRKAEKSGVTVETSHSPEAVRTYYSLHCLTRKKHGLPPQPFSFFSNIYKHAIADELGCVVIGHLAGRPISALVLLCLGNRAIYKFGASDDSFQESRANNLVMWQAIKWCIQNGHQQLHFGRTSIGTDGLRRFKLAWGAVERPIEYYKYDIQRHGFVEDPDMIHGWYNAIFRLIPVSLSRPLGSLAYLVLS